MTADGLQVLQNDKGDRVVTLTSVYDFVTGGSPGKRDINQLLDSFTSSLTAAPSDILTGTDAWHALLFAIWQPEKTSKFSSRHEAARSLNEVLTQALNRSPEDAKRDLNILVQNDLNFARVQKYIQMMNTETQKVTKMPKKSRGRQKIQAFPSGLYATEAGRQLYEDQVRLLRGDHNTSDDVLVLLSKPDDGSDNDRIWECPIPDCIEHHSRPLNRPAKVAAHIEHCHPELNGKRLDLFVVCYDDERVTLETPGVRKNGQVLDCSRVEQHSEGPGPTVAKRTRTLRSDQEESNRSAEDLIIVESSGKTPMECGVCKRLRSENEQYKSELKAAHAVVDNCRSELRAVQAELKAAQARNDQNAAFQSFAQDSLRVVGKALAK